MLHTPKLNLDNLHNDIKSHLIKKHTCQSISLYKIKLTNKSEDILEQYRYNKSSDLINKLLSNKLLASNNIKCKC